MGSLEEDHGERVSWSDVLTAMSDFSSLSSVLQRAGKATFIQKN